METETQRQDTITVETPVHKHIVVLRTYVTGRDRRALRNVYITRQSDISVEVSERDPDRREIKNILKRDVMAEAEELAWRLFIISIDGHKDGDEVDGKKFDVVQSILDMHEDDYSFVDSQVGLVSSEKKSEK